MRYNTIISCSTTYDAIREGQTTHDKTSQYDISICHTTQCNIRQYDTTHDTTNNDIIQMRQMSQTRQIRQTTQIKERTHVYIHMYILNMFTTHIS